MESKRYLVGRKMATSCTQFPTTISWTGNLPAKGTRVRWLATGKNVSWKIEGDRVVLSLPASLRKEMAAAPALAFLFTPGK